MREKLMIFYSENCPVCMEVLSFTWLDDVEFYCLENQEHKHLFKKFDIKKVPFFIIKTKYDYGEEYIVVGSGLKTLGDDRVSKYLKKE